MPPGKKRTQLDVVERIAIGQRVSVGLIAASLALISLALGLAFLTNPASLLVLAPSTGGSVSISSATAVTLAWTAPGDDANQGQADHYELRYATSPITAGTFASAQLVTGVPAPQPAGQTETFTVTGLQASTTYYFGLRTFDEANNASALSNVTTKTTDAIAQACLPTYVCSAWSSCVEGFQTRTCTVTNGCPAGLDQPITRQSCTGTVSGAVTGIRQPRIAAGVGLGSIPVVRLVDPATRRATVEFLAYARSNKSGTNVAIGDLDADGAAEVVVGTGAGSDPMVRVFTAAGRQILQFNPYTNSRRIGVAVAVDDVNGDGRDDLVTIPAGNAASHLRVFSYDATARQFTALAQAFVYPRSAKNGFSLGSGDLNLDGRADIVVAPRTNGRSIIVMRLQTDNRLVPVARFAPYPRTFDTGLTVAVADHDGNGRADIVTTPGAGFYAHVKVMSVGGRTLASFLPMPNTFRAGIDLSSYDVNSDGREEILVGPYSRSDPTLRIFRFNTLNGRFELLHSNNVFPRTMQSGLRLDAAPRI